MPATARTTKDGNFTLNSVAPGDYMLNVRSMRIIDADGGDTMMFRATIGGGDGGDGEVGVAAAHRRRRGPDERRDRHVEGRDGVRRLLVRRRREAAGIDRHAHHRGAGGHRTVRCSAAAARTAKEDGTFELKGLSGRRMLRAANLPPGWTLKAVRLNGDDVTDSGRRFKRGQDVSGLEIVATSKQTEITGTRHGRERLANQGLHRRGLLGRPAAVEPADDALGDGHAAGSGRPVPGPQPAGRAATTPSRWTTSSRARGAIPELLERLKASAKRFTLAEGGTETLDLKLDRRSTEPPSGCRRSVVRSR